MRPVFIKTFGCKVNYTESQAFAELLEKAGYLPLELGQAELPTPDELPDPVLFINSCCVTREAERKAAQYIRKIKRTRPTSEVLFSGCGARNHLARNRFSDAGARVFDFYPEAFAWLASRFAPGTAEPAKVADMDIRRIPAIDEPETPFESGLVPAGRSRAFIKVQDGCHNCCSFCIIPFVRPYASRPFDEIISEVDRRTAEGYRELVLTGINIGHYGQTPVDTTENIASDKHWRRGKLYTRDASHPSLFDLIDAILLMLPENARLRISSIEPEDLEDRFFEQLAHPRMCPHLHLPLQSGSDHILSDMRRLYDVKAYVTVAEKFRKACPSGGLTTDILVGFPTETEADFQATLDLCTTLGFERVHGFPFSPRPGTRAGRLQALPRETILSRNRLLISHCQAIADQRWQRFIGKSCRVLIEEQEGGVFTGYGEAYQPVAVQAATELPLHEIFEVNISGYQNGRLTGRLASQ